MGLTSNLGGFYTKRYETQFGDPVAFSKSRMNAIGELMARGIMTEWGVSEPDCPEDKFEAIYRRRKFPFFLGWKDVKLTSSCDEGKQALKEQSVNRVRNPLSADKVPCSTILAAMELIAGPGGELEAAQGRLDGCGGWARTCKRKAKVDIEKWDQAYSILNSYYRSGGENFLDCTTQEINDAQAETMKLYNDLLESRNQNVGISNTSLFVTLGVGIVGLTYVTLKFLK